MTSKGLVIGLSAILISTSPVAARTAGQDGEKLSNQAAETDKAKKYCMKDVFTGTRMKSRECKTKAEWAKVGVDIDEASKK